MKRVSLRSSFFSEPFNERLAIRTTPITLRPDRSPQGSQVEIGKVKLRHQNPSAVVAPEPVLNNFEALFFTKGGTDRTIYKMDLSDFSDTAWTLHGQSGTPREMHVNSVGRYIIATGGSSNPRCYITNLDTPAGTMAFLNGTGTWNDGCHYIEATGNILVTDSFEKVAVFTPAGSLVQTLTLFSTRRGRPNRVRTDPESEIMVCNVGSETNRIVSFDLSASITDNEVDLQTPGMTLLAMDRETKKIFFRDPSDALSIRSVNYDGTANELFFTHTETIGWMTWSSKTPDYIYFSVTGVGLYALQISTKSLELIIPTTTNLTRFDWAYTP